ncbi:MAG TPA: hypothetical protein V6D00_11355 [Pantanalinema sp.]
MRIGGTVSPAPVVRRQSVAAGGGESPAQAMAPDTFKASGTQAGAVSAQSAPASENKGLDLQAMTVRAQSFLSNLWDSVIGPFFKGLLGMVGLNL